MRILLFFLVLCLSRIAIAQPHADQPSKRYYKDAITHGNDSLVTQMCTQKTTLQKLRFERKNQTALHVAASAHQKEIVRTLITQCGLDPNELDATDTPPLYYARMSPGTVGTLLELGADPNQLVKLTPIPIISQFLINFVPQESLEQFLLYDVDLTQKSGMGLTPLMHAALGRRQESVKFLMAARDQGFDIAIDAEFNGKTITQLANAEIAAILAEYGVE